MTSTEHVDVVIVGAGPSGAVVAHTLAAGGLSVTCLEQGDWVGPSDYPGEAEEFELLKQRRWSYDPNIRRLPADYPLNVDQSDMAPIMWNGVGGGTIVYGGYWHRLLPSDFCVRSLDGVGDDWPISYRELAPFYREVDQMVGASGLDGDPAYPSDVTFPQPPLPIGRVGLRAAAAANALEWHWWPGSMAIPSHRHGLLEPCARMGVCEYGCPAGAKASFDLAYWPAAIRSGATLVTGARVCTISTNGCGLTDGVVWIDRNGARQRTTANAVVLCANGIGTPRLMLMSASARHPDGIGNSSGLVGRNLMLHPNCNSIGYYDDDLESWKGPAGQNVYSLQFYETHPARESVRGYKLHAFPAPGPLAAVERHRSRPFEELWGHHFHEVARRHRGGLAWGASVEDLPEDSNRVLLDGDLTDSDGLPAPKIEYRLSTNTRANLLHAAKQMKALHTAANVLDTFEEVVDAGHLMGTARMGSNPATSVVDNFGRSHDVRNLFIADGSTFVTSGAVNPTSTIAALALRLARHILESARHERVTT